MYQLRDDHKYKQKIDETLHQINVSVYIRQNEVKRLAQEKARE